MSAFCLPGPLAWYHHLWDPGLRPGASWPIRLSGLELGRQAYSACCHHRCHINQRHLTTRPASPTRSGEKRVGGGFGVYAVWASPCRGKPRTLSSRRKQLLPPRACLVLCRVGEDTGEGTEQRSGSRGAEKACRGSRHRACQWGWETARWPRVWGSGTLFLGQWLGPRHPEGNLATKSGPHTERAGFLEWTGSLQLTLWAERGTEWMDVY